MLMIRRAASVTNVVLVAGDTLEPGEVHAGPVVEIEGELELGLDVDVGTFMLEGVCKGAHDPRHRSPPGGLSLRHREILGETNPWVLGIERLLDRPKRVEPAKAPELYPVAPFTLPCLAAEVLD